MNWIKVPNSQFIRILEKRPDRDSNQGSIGYNLLKIIRGDVQTDRQAERQTGDLVLLTFLFLD
jgi:hypothetical protein